MRKIELSGKRVNEQKSILESNRIGGAPADFAAPPVGEYEFPPAPSFRSRVAIAYPHAEGFVDPVRTTRERLSSLPSESVDKVLCVNARKFFGIS